MPVAGVMMSSFRADVSFTATAFIPSPIFAVEVAGLRGSDGALAFEAGSGRESSSPTGEGADLAVQTWTQEEVDALEQAAFSRGVESAREANQDASRVCGLLEEAARELLHVSSTTIASNRGLLLGLAMEIAQKWVGEELKLDPSLFAQALNRVITASESRTGARLRLHPSDRATLITMEAESVSRWLDAYQLEIVEDDAISPGMFRIEAPEQTIDGSAEAICDRLRDALSESFEAALPEVTP